MHPPLTIYSPLLGIILLRQAILLGVNASDASTWTFNGISYISFEPDFSNFQDLHFGLRFRTQQPNGLLLYHSVQEYDQKKFPLLTTYELYVELRRGYVRVVHQLNQYSDVVTVGSALNDDRWHILNVFLDARSGELTVSLNNLTEAKTLEAFQRGNARNILKWSELHSIVSYGGFRTITDRDFFYFLGCIGDLKYARVDSTMINVPIDNTEGVIEGCTDLCAKDNQCERGKCVNLYTSSRCDCFGTGYEGKFCETKDLTKMTFKGYEWVTYQLYEKKDDQFFSDKSRISFEFKTERGSGVLLYAVGGTPYHTHVTASIHVGILHVSVSLGGTDLVFKTGLALDDNRWHNVTVSHNKRDVYVHLDGVQNHRVITGTQYFLTLDPKVYFGGGHNFVETRGLQVTQSFVGCMRNVYFNDVSVLYELSKGNSHCEYHGGLSADFNCRPVTEVPISFPKAASMLRQDVKQEQNLSVSLKFRTVRTETILFYVGLLSRKGEGGGFDFGYIEVWVNKGQPMLCFAPSRNKTFTQNLVIPAQVNDGEWHTLELTLRNSQAKLMVDTKSRNTSQYRKTLQQQGKLVLGYGLRRYKASEGFVGCMQAIRIQGKKLDPITVIESESAVGLKLDGCNLKDYCTQNNFCEHNSECLSDWDGVQCDCTEHYEGKACYFSKYPRSCNDYFQSGHNTSGIYLVDFDGSGPLDPMYVQCEMNKKHGEYYYGETVIEHNFVPNTTVRSPGLADRRYRLTYRGMSRDQLIAVTELSAKCTQRIQYDCYQSPLKLGTKTWFQAVNGEIVDYVGSQGPGYCNCPPGETCNNEKCYCDNREKKWKKDKGTNKVKKQLPLVDITVLQYLDGEGRLTLGPLHCWGNANQPLHKSITLTQQKSFVKLHAWKKGDLSLNIKTHLTSAIVLYQSPSEENPNRFSIKVIDAQRVKFDFHLNGVNLAAILHTQQALDKGDWHILIVEHDSYTIRLTLDQTHRLINLPAGVNKVSNFDGLMYIGGMSEDLAMKMGETIPGLTGCVRGFVYNTKFQDLTTQIDGSMTGVSDGCRSSCWPNPCANRGTCVEEWGTYKCLCVNRWSHHGPNCEQDINLDAVTFSGVSKDSSFLLYDMTSHPEILDKTIVLSFRTLQSEALLLYAHDQLNNFVQIELQEKSIFVSYNNYDQIVKDSVTVEGVLNDGQWKQVVVEDFYNLTKLHVEGSYKILKFKRLKLKEYTLYPFSKSFKKASVYLATSDQKPEYFVHLYVGGIPEGASAILPLSGCIRGLKIGNNVIGLADKAASKANKSVTPACDTGCHKNTCLNGGFCYEYWRYGEYHCDCADSDFSGDRCEIDPSITISGNSFVMYSFQLSTIMQHSRTEQLTMTFRTSGTRQTSSDGKKMEMMLVLVKSTKGGEYVLAKLTREGSVLLETNQGLGVYRMRVGGSFDDGRTHKMVYRRERADMYLTLDEVEEAKFGFPDDNLDGLNTIYVGGYAGEDDAFEDIANFTGVISNVAFIPVTNSQTKIRPLKELYSENNRAKIIGGNITTGSATQLIDKVTTPAPSKITVKQYEMLTMPPWEVGTAVAEIIGNPPVSPTPPPTTTTPFVRVTNLTGSVLESRVADDLTVAIAVSVIAALLIIAIIIALLLIRKRKRQGEYDVKKDMDIELKQPLNHFPPSPVPPDHLAKLDEFSMVSATLGPRPVRRIPPPEPPNRLSQSSFTQPLLPTTEVCFIDPEPMMDEDAYPNAIYNRRKKRPASSISEVLEEMERRQKSKDIGITPDGESGKSSDAGRNHGEGELEWDPVADKTPLTCGDITFFNSPLLLSIPDENEENQPENSSSLHSMEKQDEEDSGNQNSAEYNGDSGYEAESRPENTEEEATPDSTVDDDLQPKMYMYDITNLDLEESPNLSNPNRHLLATDTEA